MHESDDQDIFASKSSEDEIKEQSQAKDEESAESVKPAEISEDDIF